MDISVKGQAIQTSFEAIRVECGCGDPHSHLPPNAPPNTPCPTPKSVSSSGQLAYYHRDWKVRLVFKFLKSLGYKVTLWVG